MGYCVNNDKKKIKFLNHQKFKEKKSLKTMQNITNQMNESEAETRMGRESRKQTCLGINYNSRNIDNQESMDAYEGTVNQP